MNTVAEALRWEGDLVLTFEAMILLEGSGTSVWVGDLLNCSSVAFQGEALTQPGATRCAQALCSQVHSSVPKSHAFLGSVSLD